MTFNIGDTVKYNCNGKIRFGYIGDKRAAKGSLMPCLVYNYFYTLKNKLQPPLMPDNGNNNRYLNYSKILLIERQCNGL